MFVEHCVAESKLEERGFLKQEIFSFLAARRLMKPGALVCPSQTDGKYFTKQSKGKQRKQTNKQRMLTKRFFISITNRWRVFHRLANKGKDEQDTADH